MLLLNKMKKTIGTLLAIVLALGIYFFGVVNRETGTLGSIGDGQAYNATTTYNKLGVPLFTVLQQIKPTAGTFGSVVITGAVAGAMRFQDATSTTDVSSTTIAVFPASTAANTYVFDVAFSRGLILESVAGLQPTTTITWR